MEIEIGMFVWSAAKERENITKHGIDFLTAKEAFFDLQKKVVHDSRHSKNEPRLFCVGKVADRVLTVRFTYRGQKIRIIGAGCWRKGKKFYEKESS